MIITLTTDFGLADPFVGIMKGVILGIAPNVQLVDITHEIPSYDILEAAFIVDSAYPYFPPGTIHVVVVDPGVGSARRPLVAAANGQIFVAPDNGVLSFVVGAASQAPAPAVYWVKNDRFFLATVSHSFHGRDIFAPVAAHLAGGTPLESLGPRIADFIRKSPPRPRTQDGKLLGKVLRIDKFGNIITNLRRQDLPAEFTIHVAGSRITRVCSNFLEADPGEYFAIEGSTGYIELALNQRSAAAALNIQRGTEIEVESGLVNQ